MAAANPSADPSRLPDDDPEVRRQRTISATFAAAGLLTCLVTGAVAFYRGQVQRGLIIATLAVVSAFSVFMLRRVRRIDLVNATVLCAVSAFTLYLLVTGGTDGSGPVWVVIAPPLLLFSLGFRLGGALTAVFLVAVAVILFFPGDRLLLARLSLDFKLRFYPAVLFVASVAFFFELARARAQARYEAEIHERRRAEARAEQASRAKSEFLARLSHELRTPLAGVLGAAHLLEGRPVDPETQTLLAAQRRAGEDLRRLVDQLLDLARIEAGHLSLDLAPTDLRGLCQEALEWVRPRAAEKGLTVALELDPALPACVRADALRLKQVLGNLLSNAVKFTPAGQVRLAARRLAGGVARLVVEDTGPGVSAEDRERIFEEYVQGDAAHHRQGGAGLGLAICRELVGAMGGRITLDSEPGQGAAFGVELPLAECKEAPREARPAIPEGENLGLDVLVAEDEPVCRLVMQGMLARLGCRVELAEDGRQAVARSAARRFDCILMDCEMPVLDGYQATREIRAGEGQGGLRTPILAVTASALSADRERCLGAGMDGVLPKPVSPGELRAALQALAARSS